MVRLNALEQVLFKVQECPVYARTVQCGDSAGVRVAGKKALVRADTGAVLGIVGQSYRVVPNAEALQLGRECAALVFPHTKPNMDQWQVVQVDAPGTGSYTYIDLWHDSDKLDFLAQPSVNKSDIYGSFIRVTNSFNGMRALRFDIGYYRKVCVNGLILPQSFVHLSFTHKRGDLPAAIKFQIDRAGLQRMREKFQAQVKALSGYAVEPQFMVPLVLAVLQIHKPKPKPKPKIGAKIASERIWAEAEWTSLVNTVGQHRDKYVAELGENAYAALNVMTELASRPPVTSLIQRDRHGFQKLVGQWTTAFPEAIAAPGFKLTEHIQQLWGDKPEPAGRKELRQTPAEA